MATEMELRNLPVNYLKQYLGIKEGSAEHKEILKVFNDSGLCKRYKMTIYDAWCATAVSSSFLASGLSSIFPCVECGCGKMIALAQAAGIWNEDDTYKPSIGDVVLYSWSDGTNYATTDNRNAPDHVGIVSKVSGSSLTIIEGNYSNTVKERALQVNGRYIRGYIVPRYSSLASTSTPSSGTTTSSTTTTTTTTTSQGGFDMAKLSQIKKNSTGALVRSAQLLLNGKNSAGLDVDGDFGSLTDTAVRNYQKKKGLEVDGIIGPMTWESLLTK